MQRKGKRMQRFLVWVKRDACTFDPCPVDFLQEVASLNSEHAAACGLSLAGGGTASVIEVQALQTVAGRPAATRFEYCSQGIYGFCFLRRSSLSEAIERR